MKLHSTVLHEMCFQGLPPRGTIRPIDACFLLNVGAIFELYTVQEITQDLILAITVVFVIGLSEKGT